jgi:3'-phosphoadenosine 5'-phosphosulfate sulfotransferase (PAPS reductase)/FAD synthetase
MKTYISFSGGVESTTMCLLYGKGATAIWCDTGWEHAAMYQRMDEAEKRLTDFHGGDFTLLRVKPKAKAKGIEVDRLQDYILHGQFMPTKQMRYCTRIFKIEPIERLLEQSGECELLIGFNADEEGRTGNLEKLPNVNYRYPLIESGYTREMCEDILHLHGLHPSFPNYMQRGGCVGCIFKSIAEFKAMYFFSPDEFNDNRALEESIQDKRGKFFSLSMSQRPFSDIAKECERELSLWGREEVEKMYSKMKASQSCGAFCHR